MNIRLTSSRNPFFFMVSGRNGDLNERGLLVKFPGAVQLVGVLLVGACGLAAAVQRVDVLY